MAAGKKVTRKQLLKEPDEFLSVSARLFQLALQFKFHLMAALGGVILIVLVFTGFRYHEHMKTEEASTMLQAAWNRYQTLLKDKKPPEAYPEVKAEFERLLADYGSRPAGRQARVLLAGICYDAGDYDCAVELYRAASEEFEDPAYRDLLYNGLAYALEAKGDRKAAVEYFEKIADGSHPVLKGQALFNLGRLYADMGEEQKSQNAFSRIVENQPDSLYAELARERLVP